MVVMVDMFWMFVRSGLVCLMICLFDLTCWMLLVLVVCLLEFWFGLVFCVIDLWFVLIGLRWVDL